MFKRKDYPLKCATVRLVRKTTFELFFISAQCLNVTRAMKFDAQEVAFDF